MMNTTTDRPLLRNPLPVDALRTQMQSAPGFPHFHLDGFLDPAFAEEVHAAFPSFHEAGRLGKSFDAVNEKRKIQITDSALFPAPIARLHRLLSSDEFVATLARISGIDGLIADPALEGGGIHETNGGGRLDVHVDFNVSGATGLFRRLNVLVYFNRDWPDDWGGALDLWDRDVQRCVGAYAPLFNRLACFATSAISWHGVTPVRCPPGRTRKSFATYYYTREAPPNWNGERHSTIFRPRPEEFWRGRLAMPAGDLLRSSRSKVDAARRRLRGMLGD